MDQVISRKVIKVNIERVPLDKINPRIIKKAGYLKQTTFYIFYEPWSDIF